MALKTTQVLITAIMMVSAAGAGLAAEPRNPKVSKQNYLDCRRMAERCAGDDRNRSRRDYYRNMTRQGSGQYIYRGQRRIWTDDSQ
jgi:hypothetical protein